MDEMFQDRIDDYLLNRMNDAEKEAFLREVEQDEKKKKQLEFTKQVKGAICSREEKLRAMSEFQQHYRMKQRPAAMRQTGTNHVACFHRNVNETVTHPKRERRSKWFWISGVAAVLVVGYFAVKPMFLNESLPDGDNMPMEQIRDGDGIFDAVPNDKTFNSDEPVDTVKHYIDNKIPADE